MLPVSRKTLRLAIIVAGALILLTLIYNGLQTFIVGPKITILSPTDGSIVESPLVEVIGIAENISHITLNGATIFVDEKGNFNSLLLVASGYNIIEVGARDQFGRDEIEKVVVILK